MLCFNVILGLKLFCFCFGIFVMYDNEFETQENEIQTARINVNHNMQFGPSRHAVFQEQM